MTEAIDTGEWGEIWEASKVLQELFCSIPLCCHKSLGFLFFSSTILYTHCTLLTIYVELLVLTSNGRHQAIEYTTV
jgi:hypothetical protein